MSVFSIAYLCFRRCSDWGAGAGQQLVIVGIVTLIGFAVVAHLRGESSQPLQGRVLAVAIVAGLACIAGDVWQMQAIAAAPNPGYALAIISTSAAVVWLASLLIFRTPFEPMKLVGVLLCGAGVYLVSR